MAMAAASALVALAISAGGERRPVPCGKLHVDSSEWAQAHQAALMSRAPTDASALASNLVQCHALTGMTRQRLRRLLGAPDQTRGPGWRYQLDLNRGILSKPEYLLVEFGPTGTVRGTSLLKPR